MKGRDQIGQATVEFALVLPLVLVLLMALVQVGVIVQQQVLLVHATREAARELAVDPGRDPPSQAALADRARRIELGAVGGGLDPSRLSVEVGLPGGRVTVRSSYRAEVDVPLVVALRRFVRLAAFAEMQREID